VSLIPLIHAVCGEPAMMYESEQALPGAIILARYAVLLDGTAPQPGDAMICGSCGCTVAVEDLRPQR
jgi:hypothetical protein